MTQPVRNSRSARRAILTHWLVWLFMAGFALATPRLGLAALQSSSESEQEERYNQAVQAYTQNRFTDARTLFEGVRGSHSEEAKKYLGNIKAYKDAMEEAEGITNSLTPRRPTTTIKPSSWPARWPMTTPHFRAAVMRPCTGVSKCRNSPKWVHQWVH